MIKHIDCSIYAVRKSAPHFDNGWREAFARHVLATAWCEFCLLVDVQLAALGLVARRVIGDDAMSAIDVGLRFRLASLNGIVGVG